MLSQTPSPIFRFGVSGGSPPQQTLTPAPYCLPYWLFKRWSSAVSQLGTCIQHQSFLLLRGEKVYSIPFNEPYHVRGGDILPASEGTLIYFASYLARSVHHGTIKLYLAAVRNPHICCGHGDPLQGKLLLKKVLRGILHYQGQTRILCRPVTPSVLLAICPILRGWLGCKDFTMI